MCSPMHAWHAHLTQRLEWDEPVMEGHKRGACGESEAAAKRVRSRRYAPLSVLLAGMVGGPAGWVANALLGEREGECVCCV